MQNRNEIFIVGCQRSGTTLLSEILNRHSEISIMPETHLLILGARSNKSIIDFGKDYSKNIHLYNSYWNGNGQKKEKLDAIIRRNFSSSERVSREICNLYRAVLKDWATFEGKSIPGEKTPSHLLYWQYLLKSNPKAKVIMMFRDIRRAAHSENTKCDRIDGRTFGLLKFGMKWLISAKLIEKLSKKYPDNFIAVKFEDFIDDREKESERIFKFLGVEIEKDILEVGVVNSSFNASLDRADLQSSYQNIANYYNYVAGAQMRALGYNAESAKCRNIKQFFHKYILIISSIFGMFFPVRTYEKLRNKTGGL